MESPVCNSSCFRRKGRCGACELRALPVESVDFLGKHGPLPKPKLAADKPPHSLGRNWQYNWRVMPARTISPGGKLAGQLIVGLLTVGGLMAGPRLLHRLSSDPVHFSREIRP